MRFWHSRPVRGTGSRGPLRRQPLRQQPRPALCLCLRLHPPQLLHQLTQVLLLLMLLPPTRHHRAHPRRLRLRRPLHWRPLQLRTLRPPRPPPTPHLRLRPSMMMEEELEGGQAPGASRWLISLTILPGPSRLQSRDLSRSRLLLLRAQQQLQHPAQTPRCSRLPPSICLMPTAPALPLAHQSPPSSRPMKIRLKAGPRTTWAEQTRRRLPPCWR